MAAETWRKEGTGLKDWIEKLRRPRDKNQVGDYALTDFRGNPITIGTLVVYPSEVYGKSLQLTEGQVVDMKDGELLLRVVRRSRTGVPNLEYRRTKFQVWVKNLSNVAVVN